MSAIDGFIGQAVVVRTISGDTVTGMLMAVCPGELVIRPHAGPGQVIINADGWESVRLAPTAATRSLPRPTLN